MGRLSGVAKAAKGAKGKAVRGKYKALDAKSGAKAKVASAGQKHANKAFDKGYKGPGKVRTKASAAGAGISGSKAGKAFGAGKSKVVGAASKAKSGRAGGAVAGAGAAAGSAARKGAGKAKAINTNLKGSGRGEIKGKTVKVGKTSVTKSTMGSGRKRITAVGATRGGKMRTASITPKKRTVGYSAAGAAGGAGGYTTYKRRTKSGKVITVRRKSGR